MLKEDKHVDYVFNIFNTPTTQKAKKKLPARVRQKRNIAIKLRNTLRINTRMGTMLNLWN